MFVCQFINSGIWHSPLLGATTPKVWGHQRTSKLVLNYISYLQQELHAPSSRPNGKNNRGDDPMPD